uniref:Uncharacterized protein n=1 Tax=Glossina pallidipes TaxID=7398 RepID=A0A1A9ZB53_GLOPL
MLGEIVNYIYINDRQAISDAYFLLCWQRKDMTNTNLPLDSDYKTEYIYVNRSKSCLSRSFSNSSRAIRCLVASQSALLRPISHVAFSNSAFDLPSSLCDASNLISKRSRSLTARSSRVLSFSTSLSSPLERNSDIIISAKNDCLND